MVEKAFFFKKLVHIFLRKTNNLLSKPLMFSSIFLTPFSGIFLKNTFFKKFKKTFNPLTLRLTLFFILNFKDFKTSPTLIVVIVSLKDIVPFAALFLYKICKM